MVHRRELLKLALLAGPAGLLTRRLLAGVPASFWDDPKSPFTTPFVMDLPVPPPPGTVAAFETPECAAAVTSSTRFYKIVQEQRRVKIHPDLPPTSVWGYRDINVPVGQYPFLPGPTFMVRMGDGIIVRHINRLPADHTGYGMPHTTTHLHGGHHEARSDGFPTDSIAPGQVYDHCYALRHAGFSTGNPDLTEVPSTQWYHDHLLDFTAPNVYRGLSGFFLVFDELDTGDETSGLRLPGPVGKYDFPLVIQDRLIAPDGSLVYNPFSHNGFLGDKYLVNGVIQPRLRVAARKVRFRILNGSNARFYRLYLTDAAGNTYPFDQIATEASLLSRPFRDLEWVQLGNAEQAQIVVDFSGFPQGTELFLENRLVQDDGRGPKGTFESPEIASSGPRLMKFIVGPKAPDPSRVPDVLRPFDAIRQEELDQAEQHSFRFDRRNGAWAINGQFIDPDHPVVTVQRDTPQIWHLINKSGGWWHPIHVHLEWMRVLERNGKLPPLNERDGIARKETVILGPNDEVKVFFRFRDFPGKWAFHCHNLEHEDMFMMARFDVA